MGLDMYLYKRRYVQNWDHYGPEKQWEITAKRGGKEVKLKNPTYILEDVGQWRKANAIHKWFVENVQDGNDDCREYEVSPDQLRDLLGLVNEVLAASKLVKGKVHQGTSYKNGKKTELWEDGQVIEDPSTAEMLLPTTSGFFFGGTEYDEYYYQDLELTKEIIEDALADNNDDSYFEYCSSW